MSKPDPWPGVPGGEVRTETPDGSLQSHGDAVYSNGPYEQENYPAYGMPGMCMGGGYHLKGPGPDPMAPFSHEPSIQITNIPNGK